ncbi:CAAX AMINO TERMINAL PROTEASE FAMILY PROTEIN [Salix purpurea]|uniref:CAAX AMINO TERMINAL PROTEASE FAMILY PROTEIN n=1 Tax=Salix purpurea TaxID=77065 RepID=A0A9Q0ZSI3_SALPP|nr:CAAX AMINO TERMINAL PROTEASE FAMILY PROTEIN [Salix purpurea]
MYNKYKRKRGREGARQMRTVAPYPTVGTLPARCGVSFNKPLIQNPNPLNHTYKLKFKSNIGFKSSLKCHCIKKEITDKPIEGFSVLSSDIPCERGNIWSTMALYMFNLHVTLGIGGLSIVANVLHQPVLDPQTEVSVITACNPNFRTHCFSAST